MNYLKKSICSFPLCVCVCVDVPWQCLLLHLPDNPKEGKTWRDAMSICTSFESSLVTIEDEIEQGRDTKKLETMQLIGKDVTFLLIY